MFDLSPSHKFYFEENATQDEAPPPQNSPCETSTQDASQENPPPSLDLKSMSDDDEDLGCVDIDDFVQLQNRFDTLRKSHNALNQNVTMLTELLTNFIKVNSPQEEGHAGHVQSRHGHLCMWVRLRWFYHRMHLLHMRLRNRMLLAHMQFHSRILLQFMHMACKTHTWFLLTSPLKKPLRFSRI